jgi:hypothetical protein
MLRAKSLLGLFASFCLGSAVTAGCSGPSENSFSDNPETGATGGSGGSTGGTSGGSGGTSGSGGSGGTSGSGGSSGSTGTPPDGYLEPCESDKDCRTFSLLCDPALGCVQCLEASTCPAPAEGEAACTAGLCGSTVTCETSLQCPVDQVCDATTSRCVECVTASDCADGETCVANVCEEKTACQGPSDCAPELVCNTTSGSCVECVTGDDCDSGSCMNDTCVTPPDCNDEDTCAASGQVCDESTGECVECLTKEDCGAGEDCDDSECVLAPLNCEGTPKVALLLPRSGAMFEQPVPEANWWTAVRAALLEGDTPLIDEYDTRLDVGVRVFYRETTQDPGSEMCPIALDAETGASESEIATLLDDAQADHAADVDAELKIDAPLAETITSAVEALGDTGRRVIVLITTSIPDTCTVIDSLCGMDPAVAAAQAARAEGVEVYVLGLGENDNVDWDFSVATPIGYTGFLAALANAGRGSKVAGPPSIECEGNSGNYSASGGNSPYFHALDTQSVAGELGELFDELLAACDP